MNRYELIFTPACPYFFGNEKTFKYPGQKNGGAYGSSYYIRSEDMPSQSTILGAIRYIMLPHLWGEAGYNEAENAIAAGKESFNIDCNYTQDFGYIRSISPVYLRKKEERLIPVPLNHKAGSRTYSPFNDFQNVNTPEGDKLFSLDFDVKKGLASGFLSLKDGRVYPESAIIKPVERVGINRQTKDDGFFKKEYKQLKPGYSFAVIAELGGEPVRNTITLGQGKAPFSVKTVSCGDDFSEIIKEKLSGCPEDSVLIYCLSDCIVKDNPCEGTLFAAYQTKDYRSYTTKFDGNCRTVSKGGVLHRLVKAGSIFIVPEDGKDAWLSIHKNENAENIGMNYFMEIGRK